MANNPTMVVEIGMELAGVRNAERDLVRLNTVSAARAEAVKRAADYERQAQEIINQQKTAVQAVVDRVKDQVRQSADVVANRVKELGVVQQIASVTTKIGESLGDPLKKMYDGVTVFGNIVKTLGKDIGQIAAKIKDGMSAVVSKLGSTMKSATSNLGNTLSRSFKAFGPFMIAMALLNTATRGLQDTLNKSLKPVLNVLSEAMEAMTPIIEQLGKVLLTAIKPLMEKLLPPLVEIMRKLMPVITQMIQNAMPFLLTGLKMVLGVLVPLVDKLLPPIIKGINKLGPILTNVVNTIIDLINSLGKWINVKINIDKVDWEPISLDFEMSDDNKEELTKDLKMSFVSAFMEARKKVLEKKIQIEIDPLPPTAQGLAQIFDETKKSIEERKFNVFKIRFETDVENKQNIEKHAADLQKVIDKIRSGKYEDEDVRRAELYASKLEDIVKCETKKAAYSKIIQNALEKQNRELDKMDKKEVFKKANDQIKEMKVNIEKISYESLYPKPEKEWNYFDEVKKINNELLINQQAFNREKFNLEKDYLKAVEQIRMSTLFGEKEQEELIANITRQYDNQIRQLAEKMKKVQVDVARDLHESFNRNIIEGISTDLDNMTAQLNKIGSEFEASIKTNLALLEQQQEELKSLYDNATGYITNFIGSVASAYQNYLSTLDDIREQAKENQTTFDDRLNQLEKELSAELISYGDYYAKKAAMEEQFAKDKSNIQKQEAAATKQMLRDMFGNTINALLSELQANLLAKVAKVWMKDISEYGFAGVATAIAKTALITAAFETAKVGIKSITGLKTGGLVVDEGGEGGIDNAIRRVSVGEYVVRRDMTERHFDTIQRINRGEYRDDEIVEQIKLLRTEIGKSSVKVENSIGISNELIFDSRGYAKMENYKKYRQGFF